MNTNTEQCRFPRVQRSLSKKNDCSPFNPTAADNTMEAEMYARRDNPDLYVVETVKYRWIDN
jgi:hypothetical protein